MALIPTMVVFLPSRFRDIKLYDNEQEREHTRGRTREPRRAAS